MPRIEDLSDAQRQAVLSFPCFDFDESPFAPFNKPLPRTRLALVTTAGLHVAGDRPFAGGEQG
jgi:hypothetical protein